MIYTYTYIHAHKHTMECYSSVKKNEILPFATNWMDQRALCLSEISQTKTRYDLTFMWNLKTKQEDLQDGRGVRRGDHLPPHKYIKNTSTCGTTATEYLLNAGRRPQTSQRQDTPHIPG